MKPGAITGALASISVRPRRGSGETAAIFRPAIATVRTASRPDAGSRTRPLRRTMSYSGAAGCAARSAAPSQASRRVGVTLRLLLRLGRFGGDLLLVSRAAQDVAQAVVPFVACLELSSRARISRAAAASCGDALPAPPGGAIGSSA